MASYIHTAVIFLILVVFVYTIYLKVYSSDIIYDMLQTTVPFTSPRFIVY